MATIFTKMSNTNDEHMIASLFYQNSDAKDECDVCEEKKIINCCNRCGNSICYQCCMSFPHQYNTLFIICNNCSDEIERKFRPRLIIDWGKLSLLKEKIKKNKTYARRKRSNNK